MGGQSLWADSVAELSGITGHLLGSPRGPLAFLVSRHRLEEAGEGPGFKKQETTQKGRLNEYLSKRDGTRL